MRKSVLVLVLGNLLAAVALHAGSYADSVIAYNPGTGFATDFSTGAGFTNATASLGGPSTVTPGQFGGPVDPFNPPYLKEQIVSVGTGGSLTLGLSSPIRNDPNHPYGIDFLLFGNAGFVITNNNYTGGGITDGSLFGANAGSTRIWVSDDNVHYYQLDPKRAPTADGFFPTDGSGNFDIPVNPQLSASSFAGKNLADIRQLYNGSGGGTGYDLAWAQDSSGQTVDLPEAQFVRIDVLSGASEIDAIASISSVPEPQTLALLAIAGATVAGWRIRRSRYVRRSNRSCS